jgi:hypothetical protein
MVFIHFEEFPATNSNILYKFTTKYAKYPRRTLHQSSLPPTNSSRNTEQAALSNAARTEPRNAPQVLTLRS